MTIRFAIFSSDDNVLFYAVIKKAVEKVLQDKPYNVFLFTGLKNI